MLQGFSRLQPVYFGARQRIGEGQTPDQQETATRQAKRDLSTGKIPIHPKTKDDYPLPLPYAREAYGTPKRALQTLIILEEAINDMERHGTVASLAKAEEMKPILEARIQQFL